METRYCLALLILVGLLSLGIIGSIIEDDSLTKCHNLTKGIVTDVYQIKSRGYFVKYKYLVDSSYYSKTVSKPKWIMVGNINIGDSIDIVYSCSNSSFSDFAPVN